MSYVSTPDYTTLPTALLPLTKAHLRVDFADDDTVITEYISQAIGLLEQFWGLSLFGAAVIWTPDLSTGASRYQAPVAPVSDTFTVVDGEAVDVSADYQIERQALTDPVWLARKDGTAFHAGAVVTLAAGYTSVTALLPHQRAAILAVTGTRYEHRESTATISIDEMPHWLTDVLGGLWVPRA